MKLFLTLAALFLPSVSLASNWHAFGTCSYHQDVNGNQIFNLMSQSACKLDFYGGTGFFVSSFVWDNGNIVVLREEMMPDGTHSQTINNHRVLSVGELENSDGVEFGQCHVVKAKTGFEALCFKQLGDAISGH